MKLLPEIVGIVWAAKAYVFLDFDDFIWLSFLSVG